MKCGDRLRFVLGAQRFQIFAGELPNVMLFFYVEDRHQRGLLALLSFLNEKILLRRVATWAVP